MEWQLIENCELFGVKIPKGFKTDGASVPKFLWWFIHPAGLAFEAAVLHDYRHIEKPRMPRKDIDREFFLNLRQSGIGRFRATIAWISIRLYAMALRIK